MKYAAAILILCLVFYVSFSLLAQNNFQEDMFPGSDIEKQQEPKKIDQDEEEDNDIDYGDIFSDDQDMIARKLFQKRLPPLTKRQKIVWAFKLAEPNPFL
jgi:hypothetical protein